MKSMFSLMFVLTIIAGCTTYEKSNLSSKPCPRTVEIQSASYQEICYISAATGSDQTGDGSREKPWQSIHFALTHILDAASEKRYALFVSDGFYGGKTIELKPFVDLYGGFEAKMWQRDIMKNRTVLTGEVVRQVLIAANNAHIDGFVIMKGQFRGKGAGILCQGVSPIITNNVFIENKNLAPRPWQPKFRHEIANDGAAIYCENGAAPIIENNLFYKNTTEAGRGAAIALHSNCNGRIVNNVFLSNQTGLNDPKRSSDGGAVSIFHWSSPIIENNIFLNNKALSNNDAGALFVALWSSPVISKNIFVGNECDDDAGALFVGGQEHRYDRPLDPLPPKENFFVKISRNIFVGNKNPSMNSGIMRFTMEARGLFEKNITAFNTGIYFQRSEVVVQKNAIFDDFLFIETKQGLRPGLIKNNLIWGDFKLDTNTPVSNCNIRDGYGGENNFSEAPKLIDDGFHIFADAVQFSRSEMVSTVFVANKNFKNTNLTNRIVKAGNQWGVIKANDANTIKIWGDFSQEVSFVILSTYRLKK